MLTNHTIKCEKCEKEICENSNKLLDKNTNKYYHKNCLPWCLKEFQQELICEICCINISIEDWHYGLIVSLPINEGFKEECYHITCFQNRARLIKKLLKNVLKKRRRKILKNIAYKKRKCHSERVDHVGN